MSETTELTTGVESYVLRGDQWHRVREDGTLGSRVAQYAGPELVDALDALAAAQEEARVAKAERDEHKARWQAIFDVKAFPTPEQIYGVMARLSPRDAQTIDRAFAEGATLNAAAQFELRRSQEEARRLREVLLNVRVHTGLPPAPTLKLTCGLLTHIAEIVDNALSRGGVT